MSESSAVAAEGALSSAAGPLRLHGWLLATQAALPRQPASKSKVLVLSSTLQEVNDHHSLTLSTCSLF